MRVPRIFIFDIIDSNDEYILDRDQSHYLKNVLRLKTSMKVRLFTRSGYEYLGIIYKISKSLGIKISKIGKICNHSQKSQIINEKNEKIDLKDKGYFHKF